MSIRPTSAAAFNVVDLSARQLSVYRALEHGNKTDHEIAAFGEGMLIQSVCGARNRLMFLDLVEATSLTRTSPSGYECVVWRLKRNDPELAATDLRRDNPDQRKLAV